MRFPQSIIYLAARPSQGLCPLDPLPPAPEHRRFDPKQLVNINQDKFKQAYTSTPSLLVQNLSTSTIYPLQLNNIGDTNHQQFNPLYIDKLDTYPRVAPRNMYQLFDHIKLYD